MIDTLLIIIGFAVYIAMVAAGAWILARMNSQVRRLKESPTPKEALHVMSDLLDAQDLQISGVIRKANRNEGALEDLLLRVKSIQARVNSESRKNDQVDVTALADYIQQQQVPDATLSQPPPGNIDQDTGQEIDYR